MQVNHSNEYPYLTVNGIPLMLDDDKHGNYWSVESDPSEWIDKQDGFRIVYGDETAKQSRSDLMPFSKTLETAVSLVENEKSMFEDMGENYELPYIKGFIFID